ncbi:MAG: DUF1592 domain-containing protein [Myxococcota bacterium]
MTRAVLILVAASVVVGCSEDVESDPDLMPGPVELGPAPEYAYPAAAVPRLTQSQYRRAVQDILGENVVPPPALEPDVSIDGFVAIGAAQTSVSARGVEQYEAAAYSVAAQALSEENRGALVSCAPAGARDDGCATTVVQQVGRRAFRRDVTAEETTQLVAIAGEAGETLNDFYSGLEFALAAILQSPHFLFRAELPDAGRFGGYALASKLSFLLWDSVPDDELLDAAAAGTLDSDEGLRAQAERLLASPRAAAGVRAFFSQLYRLDGLDDVVKDPTVFTYASSDLGPFAREETLRVMEYFVLEGDRDYRELMSLERTWVNRELAALYMLPARSPEGFGEVFYPESSPRRGLLGHASVLNLHSHPVASSATLRGKFIRESLLCGQVPAPPGDVDTSLPEASADARTLRERLQTHRENPSCATCHNFLDPIGLGLENFDAVGRYRDTELDAVIDPSGELDGTAFADAIELGEAIADHPDYIRCLVSNVVRYAQSRRDPEEVQVDYLTEAFEARGRRIRALLLDLVMTPGFRSAGEVEQ